MNIQTASFYNNLAFQANKSATIKKLTQKQSDRILRNIDILNYAKQGFSPFKIAEIFNISYDTVHKVVIKNLTRISTQERHNNILKLLMQGFSRKDIASKLGISIGTVHNVAHENKTYRTFKQYRDSEIMKLLEHGVPCKEIAKIWDISVDTVWRINKVRKRESSL